MAYGVAGNKSTDSNLGHLATVYYDRRALSALRKKNPFWKVVDYRTLPKKNGKMIQFYRYSQLGSNTTPAAEGVLGNVSQQLSSGVVQATVSQYTDFISFSDMLVDTAIDGDIVAEGADQLGYRAGLTCNEIIRNEFDSAATSIDVTPLGDYFSGMDVAAVQTRFAGLDVQPFPDGYFKCLVHPYLRYDFIHDPQVGGFLDVVKQGGEGHDRLFSLENRGYIGRWSGVELWESTNLTTVAGSPNKYRTYFAGAEGIGAIDLAGRGPTRSEDQNSQKFSVNVIQEAKPSIANIEGKIRAAVSYNFVFVSKILDASTYRIRKIDAATSLGI
jgi:N4-gp56 family major capsid protein